jgi:hypothetical protein
MKLKRLSVLASVGFAALLCGPSPAPGATAPSLGVAQPFAVLGASTVTNTGPTTLNGDLGLYPGTAIPGLANITLNGSLHQTDAVALAAQNAVTTAFTSLNQPCDADLSSSDLGSVGTLTPGVYCFTSDAGLTGTLTLDAQGNPNAVFIFKIGSALTTASNSNVDMIGSGSPCNLFWRVGSSATLGTTTDFQGSILAQASITLNTGATLLGRALARTGAVTLDTNTVGASVCAPPCPPITLTPATLPEGTVGVDYTQTIRGSGGRAPYIFTVSDGALPPGLDLSAGGVLSGTPTGGGSFEFTVRGTDANGCFAEIPYTMTIIGAVPTMSQWLILLLAMVLVGLGFLRLRRRQER